jgi:hypothetical protein
MDSQKDSLIVILNNLLLSYVYVQRCLVPYFPLLPPSHAKKYPYLINSKPQLPHCFQNPAG